MQAADENLSDDVQGMEDNYGQLESKFDEIEHRIDGEKGEGSSNQDEIKEDSHKKMKDIGTALNRLEEELGDVQIENKNSLTDNLEKLEENIENVSTKKPDNLPESDEQTNLETTSQEKVEDTHENSKYIRDEKNKFTTFGESSDSEDVDKTPFEQLDKFERILKKINPENASEENTNRHTGEVDGSLKIILDNIRDSLGQLKSDKNNLEEVKNDLEGYTSSLNLYIRVNELNEQEREEIDSIIRSLSKSKLCQA